VGAIGRDGRKGKGGDERRGEERFKSAGRIAEPWCLRIRVEGVEAGASRRKCAEAVGV